MENYKVGPWDELIKKYLTPEEIEEINKQVEEELEANNFCKLDKSCCDKKLTCNK